MTKDIRIPANAKRIAREVYRHWLYTAKTSLSVGMCWEGIVDEDCRTVTVTNVIVQQSYTVPVAASWSN